MPFYTYILYSKSKDRYYVGSTSMLPEERLQYHLFNHQGYTSMAKDWKIVYREQFENSYDAIKSEKQIKSWKSKIQIHKLLQNKK